MRHGPQPEQVVYVIDDDDAVRDSLSEVLNAAGHRCKLYADPLEFLAEQEQARAGCLLLDIQLPAISGLHLQEELIAVGSTLPIIFLTGHGDVPSAVQAMKAGAFEFLEKPFLQQALLDHIKRALDLDNQKRQSIARDQELLERRATLTPRESQVLEHLVEGKASKVIAIELGLSQRTVEIYRSNIMQKMQSKSVAQLVRMLSGTSADPHLS